MNATDDAPRVFLCYDSADTEYRNRLARHLKPLEVKGELELWDESRISPGDDFRQRLTWAIDGARVAVFLISSDFLGSELIQDLQIPRLLKRRAEDGIHFLPAIVRKCLIEEVDWLEAMQVWPEDREPFPKDDEHFTELARRILDLVRGPKPIPRPQDIPPYRGLKSFGVNDAGFFFGRQREIDELVETVRSHSGPDCQNRCVAIVGASGSGKSSLARAGLLAALEAGAVPGSESWPVIDLKPGPVPLMRLGRKLNKLEGHSSASEMEKKARSLADYPQTLHNTAFYLLDGARKRRLLVLVDQCEELFTGMSTREQRIAFLANLHYAATAHGGHTVVVLTLRSDFFGDFMTVSPEARKLLDRQILIGPIDGEEEIRAVIEEPISQHGGQIEPGLVDLLLNDIEGQEGALPLLQYTLSALWRKDHHRLTVENYRTIGNLTDAVKKAADTTYSDFDESEQNFCREMFLQLVQLTGAERYSRRRVDFRDIRKLIETIGGTEETIDKILRPFLKNRLLISTGTEIKRYVEVTHEALIQNWDKAQEWLKENQAYLETRARVETVANQWDRHDRDPSFLYRGKQLSEADEYRERLLGICQEFLEASHRRERLRHILYTTAAAALLVFVILIIIWKDFQQNRRDLAERAYDLAKTNRATAALHVALEARYLARMSGIDRFPKAESALRLALASCGGEPLGTAANEYVLDAVIQDDHILLATSVGDHELRVRGIDLSLAVERSGWKENTPCIYPWPDGKQISCARLSPGGDRITVKLTPQGETQRLALSGSECKLLPEGDGDVCREALLEAGAILGDAPGWVHDGEPSAIAGERWAVTFVDGVGGGVRLWDLDAHIPGAGPEPRTADAPVGADVIVEVGESRLLYAGAGFSPEVRDLGGNLLAKPRSCDDTGGPIALSPNRRWLLGAGASGFCRWDLSIADPVGVFFKFVLGDEPVFRVAISNDGGSWAAVTSDGGAHKGSLSDPGKPLHFRLHKGRKFFLVLAFERWLATGSDQDEGLRLWDLAREHPTGEPKVPLPKTTSLLAAGPEDPSRPARWLLHAGWNADLTLLDLTEENLVPIPLRGQQGAVVAGAWSPDGRWLAAGDEEGRVLLWDLDHRDDEAVVMGKLRAEVRDLTFLSGGESLISVDAEGTLYRFRLDAESLGPIACRVAGNPPTVEEFRELVGEAVTYHDVCGRAEGGV